MFIYIDYVLDSAVLITSDHCWCACMFTKYKHHGMPAILSSPYMSWQIVSGKTEKYISFNFEVRVLANSPLHWVANCEMLQISIGLAKTVDNTFMFMAVMTLKTSGNEFSALTAPRMQLLLKCKQYAVRLSCGTDLSHTGPHWYTPVLGCLLSLSYSAFPPGGNWFIQKLWNWDRIP